MQISDSNQCLCDYPQLCDCARDEAAALILRSASADSVVDGWKTPLLERRFVRAYYDAIARHFAATRTRPLPFVVDVLQSFPACSLVADIGEQSSCQSRQLQRV
jgi:hypothetical protein